MRLYIIRHGVTDWNIIRRLQGATDIPLNEEGRELARKTALGMAGIHLDLVITSPLSRAKETAEIVKGDRQIPLLEDSRIREISFGSMEGEHVTRERRDTPGGDYYNFFHDPVKYVPRAQAESLDELEARAADFLEDMKSRTEWMDKCILVSTHGAASRALLSVIRSTPRADFWGEGVPKNCSVTIVDLMNGNWVIREQDKVFY